MSNLFFVSKRSRPALLLSGRVLARRLAVSALLGALAAGCVSNGGGSGSGEDICKGVLSSTVFSDRLDSSDSAEATMQCMPVAPMVDSAEQATCVVVEALSVSADQADACNACGGAARVPLNPLRREWVDQVQEENPQDGFNCFCEIPQLPLPPHQNPLVGCQWDPSNAPVDQNGEPLDGFCYVDAVSHVGNPQIVDSCPADERHALRFVGAGQPRPGASLFIQCWSTEVYPAPAECQGAP